MKSDSLKKRYSIKLFSNIITGIIGAILIAIVPKALGPIVYGQFIYLQNFFSQIIVFLDMGSSTAFFTKLSANNDRKELIPFYFIYASMILGGLFFLIYVMNFFGLIEFIVPDIPNQYIYMGVLYSFFTWFINIFIKISDAYALTVSVELIKVVHKLFSFLLLLYFIEQMVFDLEIYFYFHYIVLLILFTILSWLFIKKNIFEKKVFNINFEFRELFKEFKEYCSPLVIYSILGITVGLFDIWLLQKIAGSTQTGFYGLAYAIVSMCFIFTSAMTQLLTREFSKFYGNKDIENMKKLFFKYIPMLYSIAAYLGVFVAFQSENLLNIFTDEKFKDAYLVLLIMGFYPIHQTYGQLSGSLFYVTGQTKILRNISLIVQPIGVLLSFILIYLLEFEALGLALKMIIVQILWVNIQLYYNAKFLNIDIKYFLWHQVYSIVFFIVLAFIASNVTSFNSAFINFFVSGFIYTIFVVIFTYFFPQVFGTTRDEIKYNLDRVLPIRRTR